MAAGQQSFGISVHGVDAVQHRLVAMTPKLNAAMKAATETVARKIQDAARANATGPPRWVNGRNFPRGGGPGNVTGTLRSSIVASHVSGSGSQVRATVGPMAIYGRAIEFGHPHWRRSGGYPYMTPAYNKVLPTIRPIFVAAVKAAVR